MYLEIHNRRYTGCKYKLVDWIDELISENCSGESFCDIFAGTGVVTAKELNRFNRFIINDLLYSNNIIYNAFFLNEDYNLRILEEFVYDILNSHNIQDNFISLSYGNRYFSYNDAKIIGHIRKEIEKNKHLFNYKEYSILLTSLLYSADKIANTVGHYDAYIKNKPINDQFVFSFIKPYSTKDKTIEIYREDANKLARKIECDIVYIDPPYNSRQYSRFYHVLEVLTKGNEPNLYGEALKPKEENMSDYCRNSATSAFWDLINSLKCKYIVVSYNNTYNPKSSSSKNKISMNSINLILNHKGETKVFEKDYKFFNTGKTDFSDHKELIFITKVK
ncbi:MAG: DNA adenine methylase [Abditibacteriota bacterium]|nr:DNA adenine methylase [Abditibacteriota bacterium]